MTNHDHNPRPLPELQVPVVTANTVVVGTGSAGFCAADRLVSLGQDDVVMVTDNILTGASRNAGSDKQTYYKLTLAGTGPDSVREMATTLYSGGAMDGDNALVEAALSARAFLHLCEIGVPFPQNRYGEYVGYKTDHDPRQRATSVGPYTSKSMVERLQERVTRNGTRIFDRCRVVDVVVAEGSVAGLLVLRTDAPTEGAENPFLLFRCTNLVYATGGPAGLYSLGVFPHGQWGATGAALRAGVRGKNLTEWQFGLASTHPRWNVSGTYMQVMPRFVSTDATGGDEREFLTEAIPEYGRLMSAVFRKGYQWPFDVRKIHDGSSLIDLLVYRESTLRGRRVFLDFRTNPVRQELDPSALDREAHEYLERAGVLFGTPVERLKRMNLPAYELYLQKNPGVDLAKDMLRVDLCAQHNNGGLGVDAWWQANLTGFFPVGEAAGSHGVYRPGGAALNSGQVGATRAANYIATLRRDPPLPEDAFREAAEPLVSRALVLLQSARARSAASDQTPDLLRELGDLMSTKAGPIRSADSIEAALAQVRTWLRDYERTATVASGSRRSVDRLFLVRDLLTTAYVYLAAMSDYVARGSGSRGSALWYDPRGDLPRLGSGPEDPRLPVEAFRFRLDDGAQDGRVQEAAWVPGDPVAEPEITWRPVRPIPAEDDVFENVWRQFREDGGIR